MGSISISALSELVDTNFKPCFLASESSHLKHATIPDLKPGFFVVSINLYQTPRMLSPAKPSKSGGGSPDSGAPVSGAPDSGRTWVHLMAYSGCGPDFLFVLSQVTQLAESLAQLSTVEVSATELSVAQLSSVEQLSGAPCGAMLCPVVLCHDAYIPGIIRKYQVPGNIRL